ncbi:MAG TPA: hypothetical protein PKY85_10090, partial [Nitrosomonas sp.]|nr:hypothetical protein [Nitrosomonas sp.]
MCLTQNSSELFFASIALFDTLYKKMSTKTKLFFIFLLPALFSSVTTAFAQDPIVYSRCERTTATYQLTGNVT